MSCKEISADWAAQRIKGLSLSTAILNALLPKTKPKDKGEVIKTLIDSFRYPRKGPGMMWEACADKVKEMGGDHPHGHARSSAATRTPTPASGPVTYEDAQKHRHAIAGAARHLVGADAAAGQRRHAARCPSTALQAADSLKYRDFLTVVLILKDRNVFDDNWIYIHDPSVKVGRVQNFKSWSPEMVPDPSMNCYGLEYFCFEGDGLWTSSRRRADRAGQAGAGARSAWPSRRTCVDGCVVRQPKAYPVYDDDYAKHVATIRDELEAKYPNAAPGRPQRHAQVQQPGPRHDDGDAVREEHPGRREALRSVAGEPGRRVPRSRQGGRTSRARSGLRLVPTRVAKPEEVGAAS